MKIWNCGQYALEIGAKTYIMGIVNATPDSFSGDGARGEAALNHALQMVENGADILDIGGESTRPGAAKVSLDEELSRVVPLIEKLAARVEIPLSVDTTKSEVARAAIDVGASIVNDISGATFDEWMLKIVAATDAGLILMHLRGTPQTMRASEAVTLDPTLTLPINGEGTGPHFASQKLPQPQPGPVPSPLVGRVRVGSNDENSLISEILAFWQSRLDATSAAGIAENRLCFDAGFGFGKSLEENLEILRRGRELSAFGFPVLSGTSRKSTIGKILGDAPVEARIFGTAATVAIAISRGADIVRVHDVREMRDVTRVCDAITR